MTLDLYDLAVGPPDPHQGPDPSHGWPGDSRWDPPTTILVDHAHVIAPQVIAEHDPPAGYRYSTSGPPSRTRTVHLVNVADLATSRADGRRTLCGRLDQYDVPHPDGHPDGHLVCRACLTAIHPPQQEQQ